MTFGYYVKGSIFCIFVSLLLHRTETFVCRIEDGALTSDWRCCPGLINSQMNVGELRGGR